MVVVSRRTVCKSAAGFALAGLLCYILGQLLQLSEVLAVLRSADPAWLVVASMLTFAGVGAVGLALGDAVPAVLQLPLLGGGVRRPGQPARQRRPHARRDRRYGGGDVLLLTTLGGLPVATAAGIALLHRLTSYWFIVGTGSLAAGWIGVR